MNKFVKFDNSSEEKYLIVPVGEQVPMRDENGHLLTYGDDETVIERQIVVDEDGFPVLDEDGNETFEDVEVPAPFGEIKTETKHRAYRVPLALDMDTVSLKGFREAIRLSDNGDEYAMNDWFEAYIRRFIPNRVVDGMKQRELLTLMKAWGDANNDEGVTQGE